MPKQTFFNLPGEKKNKILTCALEEFAQQGYEKFSISRMVAAAGIAKGSFYQYFENKDDLYAHVMDEFIAIPKLKTSAREEPKLLELNLTEFMRMLFRALLEEFSRQPLVVRLGIDFLKNQHGPAQRRYMEKYQNIQDNYFKNFVLSEQSRNEIDPAVDADVLGGLLTGISLLAARELLRIDIADAPEFVDGLVDKIEYILTHGIYKNTSGTEEG